jgi:outer membrane lipoprotein SlyB
VRAETLNELVIRVDDGREVILRDEAMQRFVAGERVRLEPGSRGPRVERE